MIHEKTLSDEDLEKIETLADKVWSSYCDLSTQELLVSVKTLITTVKRLKENQRKILENYKKLYDAADAAHDCRDYWQGDKPETRIQGGGVGCDILNDAMAIFSENKEDDK